MTRESSVIPISERYDYLTDLLVDLRFVTSEQVEATRTEAVAKNAGIVALLVEKGLLKREQLVQAKAAHFGADVIQLTNLSIPGDVIATIPASWARNYKVIPVSKDARKITMAIADPSDLAAVDSLHHLLKTDSLAFVVASDEEIEAALARYYPQ